GIPGAHSCGILYVIRRRSVATLAANSQFVGRDYLVRRNLERAGRVTTEAAENSGLGIKDPVLYSAPGLMARRTSNAIKSPVPGSILLHIGFGIEPTYKCDGLYTRAKRPESGLWGFRRRQRAGVSAGRLLAKLSGMALGACRRSRILGRRRPGQKIQWQ